MAAHNYFTITTNYQQTKHRVLTGSDISWTARRLGLCAPSQSGHCLVGSPHDLERPATWTKQICIFHESPAKSHVNQLLVCSSGGRTRNHQFRLNNLITQPPCVLNTGWCASWGAVPSLNNGHCSPGGRKQVHLSNGCRQQRLVHFFWCVNA